MITRHPDVNSVAPSPTLLFQPCNGSAFQQYEVVGGTVQWMGGGTPLCITFSAAAGYNSPLILTPCVAGFPNQSWVYAAAPANSFSNNVSMCSGPGGACLQWSGQESTSCMFNPPVLGPGCIIGTWPVASPTSWNNQFTFNGSSGLIEAMWASATGPTPSGQCATVTLPPPPVPPTADILAWSKKEVMCLYGE